MRQINGIPYTRKVKLNSLTLAERTVGSTIAFRWQCYRVVHLDAQMAYLLALTK